MIYFTLQSTNNGGCRLKRKMWFKWWTHLILFEIHTLNWRQSGSVVISFSKGWELCSNTFPEHDMKNCLCKHCTFKISALSCGIYSSYLFTSILPMQLNLRWGRGRRNMCILFCCTLSSFLPYNKLAEIKPQIYPDLKRPQIGKNYLPIFHLN